MNKRFWRGLMAITLGLMLVLGNSGCLSVREAWASETGGSETTVVAPQNTDAKEAKTEEKSEVKPEVKPEEKPAAKPEEKPEVKPDAPKKQMSIVYSAGSAGSATVKQDSFAGASVRKFSSFGWTPPAGKVFDYWSAGGTKYTEGSKFSSDESKIPSKLTANWKDAPVQDQPEPENEENKKKDELVAAMALNNAPPANTTTDGNPPADNPPANNPPADNPPADNPPANNPPADNPPADNPPAVNPPADNPPADNPPAVNPPADNPPADNPPANNPPADNPPAVNPPANTTTDGNPPAGTENTTVVEGGAESTEKITVTFHLGDASASLTLAKGDALPGPAALGLTIPEGQAFWCWSSSATEASDDAAAVGDPLPATMPAHLYALCEAVEISNSVALMSIPRPAAFTEVRYHLDGATAAYTTSSNTATALKYKEDLHFEKTGYQFQHWSTSTTGSPAIAPDSSIFTLPANETTTDGKSVLNLYGVWNETSLPKLSLKQTSNREYLGRGESMTFSITVSNTDASKDAFVRVENDVDPSLTISGVTGQHAQWDLRVKAGRSETVTLVVKVNDNAANSIIDNTAKVTREVLVTSANTDLGPTAALNASAPYEGPVSTYRVDVVRVIYHGNGGKTSGGATETYDSYNYGVVQNNPFALTGGTFVCWNTSADGKGTDYAPGGSINALNVFSTDKDFHLYAKWASPALSISMFTGGGVVAPNQQMTYAIQLKNTGSVAANNVVIEDAVPADLTYTGSSPAAAVVSGSIMRWSGINVPANQTVTLRLYATVKNNVASAITNTVSVKSINGVAVTDPALTASVTSPISTRRIVYNGNGGTIAVSGEATYLANGDGAPTVLSNTVMGFARGGYQLVGWSDGKTTFTEGAALTIPATNVLNLYAVWISGTNLSITQKADKTSAVPGENVVFTISIVNSGSAAALDVKITENDSGLTPYANFVDGSVKASAGSYNQSTREWSIPRLNANATATLQLTYRVKTSGIAGYERMLSAVAITAHTPESGAVPYVTKGGDEVAVNLSVDSGVLNVSNRVSGNYASTTRGFTFTLRLKAADGGTLTGSGSYTTSNGSGGAFNMSEKLEFTLKHGESIRFWNLPAGAQYSVEESNYGGYWPNHTHVSGVIRGETSEEFVNSRNRNTDIPKTGYGNGNRALLWLTPLLAGALWLLILKRRKHMADQ